MKHIIIIIIFFLLGSISFLIGLFYWLWDFKAESFDRGEELLNRKFNWVNIENLKFFK